MGHKPMPPEMKKFIDELKKNEKDSIRKKQKKIIMFYSNTCPVCHMMIERIKGRTQDGNEKEKSEMKELMEKILLVEESEPHSIKLTTEADSWAKKLSNDDMKIKFTPSYLDFDTHQIYEVGLQKIETLKEITSDKYLQSKRTDFKSEFSKKLSPDCDKVACGLKESFKIEVEDEEPEKSEKNGKNAIKSVGRILSNAGGATKLK